MTTQHSRSDRARSPLHALDLRNRLLVDYTGSPQNHSLVRTNQRPCNDRNLYRTPGVDPRQAQRQICLHRDNRQFGMGQQRLLLPARLPQCGMGDDGL